MLFSVVSYYGGHKLSIDKTHYISFLNFPRAPKMTTYTPVLKPIPIISPPPRYLNVRGCEAVSDDALEVIARSCTKLRALDIGKCDVTDRGLRLISHHCPNLRKLSVKSCEMITDEGIQIIAYYCRGLQQLNVQDCPITLDGYRIVKKFCKRCIIEHTNPGFN